MFFKTGALKHFSIFTGKHRFWSLFLLKSNSIAIVFQWILINFYEQLFLKNTSSDCFFQLDKVTFRYWVSVHPPNQKHNVEWFLLKRFVNLVRVCSLHMYVLFSRNQPNIFLLINLQKTKTCPKKTFVMKLLVLGYWLLVLKQNFNSLDRFLSITSCLFNSNPINRWIHLSKSLGTLLSCDLFRKRIDK